MKRSTFKTAAVAAGTVALVAALAEQFATGPDPVALLGAVTPKRLDDLAEFIFSLDVKFADLSMTCQFLERFRQFLKRPDDDSAHGKV